MLLLLASAPFPVSGQETVNPPPKTQSGSNPTSPTSTSTPPAVPTGPNVKQKAQTEQDELRKAIDEASNDRAALVKNLEAFLKKYPESAQRPQIYRALVESSLQLRDFARATDYAERMVSLNPEDISNEVLSIELLERYGDVPGKRRAVFYTSRVLEYLDKAPVTEKSPRVSTDEWAASKKKDKTSLLLVRGRLYEKLGDMPRAQEDFEASYALVPGAIAADHLGEIAELKKDWNNALLEYARAFALTDGLNGAPPRGEIRKKIGNVWRLAHGSDDGLGDYLLRNFDDTMAATAPVRGAAKNAGAKEPYEFVLRNVRGGGPVPLADAKGKILVLSFWTTWCGPCKELEPRLDRIAATYVARQDVVFYALNCDDDEARVLPYLEGVKLRMPILFADGLADLLGVNAFPTTMILDRGGKIAFRADGFDPESFDKTLREAVERTAATSATTARK